MPAITEKLAAKHCKELRPGTPAVKPAQVKKLLAALRGWQVVHGVLTRAFKFKNYYETMAFVNAVAWISHQQNHHPDLQVGYNTCTVTYVTHSVGGLSENDFICAAGVQLLMQA